MLGLTRYVDAAAEKLLELRTISGAQWLLRLLGAAAMVSALILATPGGWLTAGVFSAVALLLVPVLLLAQLFRPDSAAGLAAMGLMVLCFLGQGEVSLLRIGAVGLLMLVAHVAWSWAALGPAHGVFLSSLWRSAGGVTLVVLAGSLVTGGLVLALSGVRLAPAVIVVGVLAVITLLIALLPRKKARAREKP
jgi:hypothetical protein